MSIRDFNIDGRLRPDEKVRILRFDYRGQKAGSPWGLYRNVAGQLRQSRNELFMAPLTRGAVKCAWLDSSFLLPLSEYLTKKPKDNFFTVGKKSNLRNNGAYMIKDPTNKYRALTINNPFRFESCGEAIFCMAQLGLTSRSYFIQHWMMNL